MNFWSTRLGKTKFTTEKKERKKKERKTLPCINKIQYYIEAAAMLGFYLGFYNVITREYLANIIINMLQNDVSNAFITYHYYSCK